MDSFLRVNGRTLELSDEALFALVMSVAAGDRKKEDLIESS